MPALARVRNQTKALICLSNLRQFGLAFEMYTSTNNSYFGAGCFTAPTGVPSCGGHRWPITLEPYYENRKLLLCPMAKKSSGLIFGRKFEAWDYTVESGNWVSTPQDTEGYLSSYGINEWVSNPPAGAFDLGGMPDSTWWRTPNIRGADNIPVLMDCLHSGHFPRPQVDQPPWHDGEIEGHAMKLFCIDRHSGHVNGLFMDFTVRKVGLKELWTLDWHRGANTATQWTIAGWPTKAMCANHWDNQRPWMKDFKDY